MHRDHNGVSRTRCFHAVCLTDVEKVSRSQFPGTWWWFPA
jgi:hypothetical protein